MPCFAVYNSMVMCYTIYINNELILTLTKKENKMKNVNFDFEAQAAHHWQEQKARLAEYKYVVVLKLAGGKYAGSEVIVKADNPNYMDDVALSDARSPYGVKSTILDVESLEKADEVIKTFESYAKPFGSELPEYNKLH